MPPSPSSALCPFNLVSCKMGLFLTPNGSVRWKVKSWISGADSPAKALTAGGLLCLLHSDLPRPPCLWEPDQKNVGRSERAQGWQAQLLARGELTFSCCKYSYIILGTRPPDSLRYLLHALQMETRGSTPELSQHKGAKGAFPMYICIFIFLVYVERKWLCVEPWLENGKIRAEILVRKANFLGSNSSQTHKDHFKIKLNSSWKGTCCFKHMKDSVFLLGSQFVQHIHLIYNKNIQEIFRSTNEIAMNERVRLPRRVVLSQIWEIMEALRCPAGF